jgi:hypothetical protein
MKKLTRVFIIVAAFLLIFALWACNGGTTTTTPTIWPTPLADLANYGTSYHWNLDPIVYGDGVPAREAARLEIKRQDSQEEYMTIPSSQNARNLTSLSFADFNLTEFGEIEAATFMAIFVFADPLQIINRLSIAAVSEANMVNLVSYISRSDTGIPNFNMKLGIGSAIRDYQDFVDLNDLPEDTRVHISNWNGETNIVSAYEAAQLKRRKLFGELFEIFGADSGYQLARAAVQLLAYSQQVATDVILPKVVEAHIMALSTISSVLQSNPAKQETRINSMDLLFTDFFFDHGSLVYLKAFNATVGAMTNFAVTNQMARPMLTLYGFYYQFESNEYRAFSDAEAQEFLALGQLDYFVADGNEAQALRYRDLQERRYVRAVRYNATFLRTFYTAQLDFQEHQETFDRQIYQQFHTNGWRNLPQISEGGIDLTYAGQMKNAHGAVGNCRINSNLIISDINFLFMRNDENVRRQARTDRAYVTLPQATRTAIENNRWSNQNARRDNILYVERSIAGLRGLEFSLSHARTTDNDFSNALMFQIWSYRADYVRNVQSTRKDTYILHLEVLRANARLGETHQGWLESDLDGGDVETLQAVNADKMGRNGVLITNMDNNFINANTGRNENEGQQAQARGHVWTVGEASILSNIRYTIKTDGHYRNQHEMPTGANNVPRWQNQHAQGGQVKDMFDNTLIRREGNDRNGELDTSWAISRLLFNHETVIRHANGQVVASYRELANASEFAQYRINSANATSFSMSQIPTDADMSITFDDPDNELRPIFAFLDRNPSARISQDISISETPTDWYRTNGGVTAVPSRYESRVANETIERGDSLQSLGFGLNAVQANSADANRPAIPSATSRAAYVQIQNEGFIVFIFAAWYLDENFNYIVRPSDTFPVDVWLYPAYFMFRVATQPGADVPLIT